MAGLITYLIATALFGAALAGTLLFIVPGFIGMMTGHPWGVAGAAAWWLSWTGIITVWQGGLFESSLPAAVPYLVALGVLAACCVSIYRTINLPDHEGGLVFVDWT